MSKDQTQLSLENTQKAVVVGMQRSLGLIFEYPLDNIKSRWQVAETSSIFKTIRHTYGTYGFVGYYHGFAPNLMKKIAPQLYRWSLLLQLPNYFSDKLQVSKSIPNPYYRTFLGNLFAGILIGSVETILAAPFDACRLELIINREKTTSLKKYLQETSLRQHFLGLDALFFKEIFGWSSFLVGCNLLRMLTHSINQEKNIYPYQVVAISAVVATINAIVYLPWDVARTQIQRNKYTTNLKSHSVFNTLKNIKETSGAKTLWRGFGIRFFQMTLATTLSIPAMEKYERSVVTKN